MLSSSLNLSIYKDSSVSVRDQLIESIGLQIASGTLKAKDKLPSVRALAQKLSIHHSTVTSAYNQLAEVGLLEIRQGSGVRVAGQSPVAANSNKDLPLPALFRQFVFQASENGYSREDLREYVSQQLSASPVKRILVVDRNRDFHPIPSSELSPCFDIPVQPITFEELNQTKELLSDSLIVTSLYHFLPVQSLILDPTRFVLCTVEPGKEEIETISSLRTGSIVGIVSVSSTLMKIATNMAAAIRGEQIAVRCVAPGDKTELAYLLKHADAIICDRPSESSVRALSGKAPIQAFRLYSQATIDLIKTRLKKWG